MAKSGPRRGRLSRLSTQLSPMGSAAGPVLFGFVIGLILDTAKDTTMAQRGTLRVGQRFSMPAPPAGEQPVHVKGDKYAYSVPGVYTHGDIVHTVTA